MGGGCTMEVGGGGGGECFVGELWCILDKRLSNGLIACMYD